MSGAVVIGISFDGMDAAKGIIHKAMDAANAELDDLARAASSLQVYDGRLVQKAGALDSMRNRINGRITGLQQMNAHIDYAVRRFKETDELCAQRIKAETCEIKKTLGLARGGGVFGDIIGGIESIVDMGEKAWNSIEKWTEDHKKEIIEGVAIAAVAALSITLGVLTLGASVPAEMALLAAMGGGALIGGGIGLGAIEIADFADNGKLDTPAKQYIASYTGGAIAGGLMPLGGELMPAANAAWCGLSSMTGDVAQQFIGKGNVDYGEALTAGVTGGIFAYGMNKLIPVITGSRLNLVNSERIAVSKTAAEADAGVSDVDGIFGVVKKTGIGKTGEGIPLDEVKPEVLKKVHLDDNAAYGYSPNEGTPYADYDFTDIEKVQQNRAIREEYLEQSKKIQEEIDKVAQQGASKEEIAEKVVNMRNQEKIDARAKMSPEELAPIEARNIKLYGDPVGPTAEQIFDECKKGLIKKQLFESDEQVWDMIIQKSMKKDDILNTLLGIKH